MAATRVAQRPYRVCCILALLATLQPALAVPNPLPVAAPLPQPFAEPEAQPTAAPLAEALLHSSTSRQRRNADAIPEPHPLAEAIADAEAAPLPAAEPILDAAGQPISPRDGYCNGAQYCAFSGAVYITGSGAYTQGGGTNTVTPAQQVQCPGGYPTRCDSIGESDYCCPSDNYCAFDTNSAVACCPNGETCQGAAGGYQPTSYYQPPTTTVYAGGGGVVAPAGYTTTYYQQPTTTAAYYGNGYYCSTLVEVGPNLPTTAQGDCGTILIVAPAEAARIAMGFCKLLLTVGALQVAGGLVFGFLKLR